MENHFVHSIGWPSEVFSHICSEGFAENSEIKLFSVAIVSGFGMG
jgi:hypothetical protein